MKRTTKPGIVAGGLVLLTIAILVPLVAGIATRDYGLAALAAIPCGFVPLIPSAWQWANPPALDVPMVAVRATPGFVNLDDYLDD
jgi:hypothetical protein